MSRASWALAVALAVTAWPDHDVTTWPGPAGAAASTQTSITRLFTAYAAGDTTIVNRTLRRDVDYLDIKREFEAALTQWHDWQFVQAGFVFEVVLAVVERDMASMPDVVSRARAFITSRTDPIGASETRDAFELLWHRAMLALLQGAKQSRLADEYVQANSSRVGSVPVADGPPRLIDPRLALEHAIITEQFTTPDSLAAATLSRWVPLAIDPGDAKIKPRVDRTLHELDQALQIPETAAEASLRKAFVLHRLGDHDAALALLDAAGSRTRDRVLLYWIDLVRGRTLQATGRLDAAADAYNHAQQSWPNAQSPAVALSALCLLQDRRDEARRWAAMAQSRPADAIDPWWQYWQGDFRFISDWLGTLRRVARAGA